MKRLVQIKSSGEFLPSEAKFGKFYGIKHANDKGFVTMGYNAGGEKIYIPHCLTNLTGGNCWDGTKTSLQEALEDLSYRCFEVCEFDTFLEMAQWLSE